MQTLGPKTRRHLNSGISQILYLVLTWNVVMSMSDDFAKVVNAIFLQSILKWCDCIIKRFTINHQTHLLNRLDSRLAKSEQNRLLFACHFNLSCWVIECNFRFQIKLELNQILNSLRIKSSLSTRRRLLILHGAFRRYSEPSQWLDNSMITTIRVSV